MPAGKIILGPAKKVFKGKIFQISQREVCFPNGRKKFFEYCFRPDSVTVLAFDDKDRLLLIKEKRHRSKGEVWFLPAGKVDKGESYLAAAKRELREETGYGARKFKKISQKSPSNMLIWDIHIYAAKNLYHAPLQGDELFPIEVVPTPFEKAVEMALNGTIENEFIAFHIVRFNYMLKYGQFKW